MVPTAAHEEKWCSMLACACCCAPKRAHLQRSPSRLLRPCRHPLLLGAHLQAKDQAERESRRTPASAVLRRRAAAESSAMGDAPGSGNGAAEAGQQLPPNPQPIDVTVRPQTRAVVITGGLGTYLQG